VAASTLAVRPRSPANLSPESHEQNATTLLNLWRIGEQLDPLKIALSGFPDVNTYRAYYEGAGNETE
jgi:hypothetical protein